MFRTDLNHFLQSFDSNAFHRFMEVISFMGTVYMLLLTILVLIGGINFRKGFLVLNILGWGVLFMLGAKTYFDYPRPLAVDNELQSFGRAQTTEDLTGLQPINFFEGFSPKLLSIIRSKDVARFGLPSGHTMIITAVWLGLALLFRRKWLCIFSVSLILLTMISRMYLGMHYLGDVLLGLVLGLFFSVGFNVFYSRIKLKEAIGRSMVSYVFFSAPFALFALYNFVSGFQAGALIGLNGGLLLILLVWGEPILVASLGKRILNTFLFVTLYFGMYIISKKAGIAKEGILSMLIFSALNFTILIISFYLGKLIGSYKFMKA